MSTIDVTSATPRTTHMQEGNGDNLTFNHDTSKEDDLIRHFNNVGVYWFQQGEYATAETFFLQAMANTFSVNEMVDDDDIEDDDDHEDSDKIDNQRQLLSLLLNRPAVAATKPADSASRLGATPNWGVDEGMDCHHFFSDAVLLQPLRDTAKSRRSIVAATLWFNLAQTLRLLLPVNGGWNDRDDQDALLFATCQQVLHSLGIMTTVEATHRASTSTSAPLNDAGHDILVSTLHGMGCLLYQRGQLDQAAVHFERALSYCRLRDGGCSETMTRIACIRQCIGVVYYHRLIHAATAPTIAQDSVHLSDAALDHLQAALSVFSQQGNSSQSTSVQRVATTCLNLGRLLLHRGEYQRALHILHQSRLLQHELQMTTHGIATMHTMESALTAFYAGQAYQHLGDSRHAMKLYQNFLSHKTVQQSEPNRDVSFCLARLAQIYETAPRDDAKTHALHLYRQSVAIGQVAFRGDKHNRTVLAGVYNRMGNLYFDGEQWDDALDAYQQGLSIEQEAAKAAEAAVDVNNSKTARRRSNNPWYANVAITLLNLGEVCRRQRCFGQAIDYYTQAMAIQTVLHGPESAPVATILNAIGLAHAQLGHFERALQVLHQALDIRRTVLSERHLDVAATLTDMGVILSTCHKASDALDMLQVALSIRVHKLGRNHRTVSFIVYNMGICHQLEGRYDEAIACYQEALCVEIFVLGDQHRDVALTLFKLGEVYKLQGHTEAALQSFLQSLAIERVQNDANPAAMSTTLHEIGALYFVQGNVGHMMKSLTEAARLHDLDNVRDNAANATGSTTATDGARSSSSSFLPTLGSSASTEGSCQAIAAAARAIGDDGHAAAAAAA